MSTSKPYNPLDKRNLGKSVTDGLLTSAPDPLGSVEDFPGAGIYALYYLGDFPPYLPITHLNRNDRFEMPIYLGKAVPEGSRKGGIVWEDYGGKALSRRLREHAESIDQAENLKLDDFLCRYLVVDDIWIPLGESLLIGKYAPLWNKFIDGFGNHDPGSGRYGQLRSRWDVLHPGRSWAHRCKPRGETVQQIIDDVDCFLRDHL